MPFTLAHPAAVMPLRRLKFLQAQALIIGSMMPDLPYFFPGWFLSRYVHKLDTHTFVGSFRLDIPFGLIVLCATLLLRYPLTALLPDRAKWICLDAAKRFTARPLNWLLAIPSILIGAWTHMLWDSFTHDGGWMVQRVDALRAWVTVFGYTGQVCHILQYISSVFGLIVLAYWYYLATKEAPHDYGPRALSRQRRLQLLGLVVLVAAVIGITQAIHAHDESRSTIYGWEYLILTRWVAWCGLLFFIAGTIVTLADLAHSARNKSAQEAEHA
jgi:hypothetical protein